MTKKMKPIRAVWWGPPNGKSFVGIEAALRFEHIDIVKHVTERDNHSAGLPRDVDVVLVHDMTRGPVLRQAIAVAKRNGTKVITTSTNARVTLQRLADEGIVPAVVETTAPVIAKLNDDKPLKATVGDAIAARVTPPMTPTPPVPPAPIITPAAPTTKPTPPMKHTPTALGWKMAAPIVVRLLNTGECLERHLLEAVEADGYVVSNSTINACLWKLYRAGVVESRRVVHVGRSMNMWRIVRPVDPDDVLDMLSMARSTHEHITIAEVARIMRNLDIDSATRKTYTTGCPSTWRSLP